MSSIPCIINNRNRLTTTQKLCQQLHDKGYTNIYIMDMVSTYEPLLHWYKEQTLAQVIYIQDNIGHKALWNSDVMGRFKEYPFIVYTDSDIELGPKTPNDFIEQMVVVAKDYRMDKVGLAIRIDNLPDTKLTSYIKRTEGGYWNTKMPHKNLDIYRSNVDTTFCVVRTGRPYTLTALRIGGDYTCIHTPWYLDYSNLAKEEQYILDHADSRFSSYKKLLTL